MPGGLVRDVGVQGDGAVREVVDGEVPVDDRVDAVFPGQVRLEVVIGLFQGVPVGDDGEIDPDFLHGIAGRGYLAVAVTGEIARVRAVPGILEAGLDQGRPEGRRRAGDRNALEGEGSRCRSGRGRSLRGLRLGGRLLALVFADAQFPFQVLDVLDEVLVDDRLVILLFRAEPAAGFLRTSFPGSDRSAGVPRAAGQGNHASELVGTPPHGQEDDRHSNDQLEEFLQSILHDYRCFGDFLFPEIPRSEGEGEAESGVPVLPAVPAVADAELAADAAGAHLLEEGDGQVHEAVVVAAVEEPLHGAELLEGGVIGLVDEREGGMLVDGLAHQVELVLGHVRVRLGVVQPAAHRIAAGEQVRVALGIDGAAAAAHGQAHHGAVRLVAVDLVAEFDRGDELLEEEILVGMAGHVEIAVPVVVDVGVAGVGHDDDHRHDFAAGGEFVHHIFHMTRGRPVLVGAVQAVKEVDDRVLPVRRGVVAGGQVYVDVDGTAQKGAFDGVVADFTLAERLAGEGREEQQACEEAQHQSFHNR